MASEGFNFRATLAYVTDPTDTQFVDATTTYPTTSGGVTFGWDSSLGANERDRSTGVDARIAGIHFTSNDGSSQRTFRVDLAGTGNHDITLAMGDASANQQDQYCQFKDDTTVISTIDKDTLTITAGKKYDAIGDEYTDAAFFANHTKKSYSFSSTIFRAVIGQPTANTGNTAIAHLAIESVDGGVTTRRYSLSLTGVG